MSKSLLIGSVRRSAPELEDLAVRRVVDALLHAIAEELDRHGRFSLPKVGTMSLEVRGGKAADDVTRTEGVEDAQASAEGLAILRDAVRAADAAVDARLADQIVDGVIALIGDELVKFGAFSLQRIGSLTIQATEPDDSPSEQADDARREIGVAARFRASRFIIERVRASFARRRSAAGVA